VQLCLKVISKIIANRLKSILPDLISEEQSAFVGGRQIQDNVLLVQEVLHQLRIKKGRSTYPAVLKVDMRKAYDRVEWDFLQDYLLKLGFHPIWLNWTMQCISTQSSCVKLNGEHLTYFHPSRGLRQGDPLSPYLFILLANLLSTLIKKAVDLDHITGIKLNRWCPSLTHLFFADDAIFFLHGTITECQNLSNILQQYCIATGQEINRNKSGIYCAKDCPLSLQQNLASELRVPIINKCGKYLGIPSDWGRSKKDMFSWILSRVHSKLESWKANLISKGGKEILLKTVIQAIPQYAMSTFKLPMSICRSIERSIARFWWQNDRNKSGIHWRSWDVLKKRKADGGLGFRDLI